MAIQNKSAKAKTIGSFFKSLRAAAGKGFDATTLNNAWKGALGATSDLPVGVHDILKNIEFQYNDTKKLLETTNTKVPLEEVNGYIRRGDLSGLVKRLQLNVHVSGSTEKGFQAITGDMIPEFHAEKIEQKYQQMKSKHSDLDVMPGNSPEDLRTALGKKGVEKVNKVGNKLKLLAGTGAIAIGIYAVWDLTSDFIETLHAAALANSGCFLLTTVNGKTTSCKLSGRSCLNPSQSEGVEMCKGDPYKYNYMSLIANSLENKIDMAEMFGSPTAITTAEQVKEALANNELKQNLIDYYKANEDELAGTLQICYDSDVLEPSRSRCRACDSSADADKITYFYDDNLAENMALQCKPPGSILETLVDVTEGAGANLIDILGGLFGFNPKTIFIGAVVLGIILLLIMIIPRLGSKPQQQPQQILAQQPQQILAQQPQPYAQTPMETG